MAKYRLSPLAFADLKQIFTYTVENFGRRQAEAYRDGLKACCEKLAHNPDMGIRAEDLTPALQSFDFRSHRLYYLKTDNEIFIVRILHQSMNASAHL